MTEAVETTVTETPAAPVDPAARWAAMEAKLGGGADAEEKPAETAQGEAKTPGKTALLKPTDADLEPTDAERAQLLELAKKLGFEVDDKRVETKDRAEFRRWRESQKSTISKLEADLERKRAEAEEHYSKRTAEAEAKAAERLKEAESELEFSNKLSQAAEDGDYDGLAVLLGHKDWNELQQGVIAKFADPNYKELQELKKWRIEQEEARTKAAKEAEAKAAEEKRQQEELTRQQQHQQEMQARQQQLAAYHRQLSEKMATSEDALTRSMSSDPSYVAAIVRIQQENWDPETESTVTPEQAVKLAVKGANTPLAAELQSLYQRLHSVFGASIADNVPVTTGQEKKPAPKSAPVPTKGTKAAAGPAKFANKQDWEKYRNQRLAEAIAEDTLAEKQQRG